MTDGRRSGLDWVDVMIHAGVTFALAAAAAGAARQDEGIVIGLVVAASLVILGWRRSRAPRQGPGTESGEFRGERLAELEQRMLELEGQQGRMLELEERLDFTERMLAQQRETPRVGPGER